MGTRAWGQGAFWQPQSPEKAEPRTEQPGSAGPQPTLHHSVLAAVPGSPENRLARCPLPVRANPRRRNLRASPGIARLVLPAGMPRTQHPHGSMPRDILTFCTSSVSQTTPFHQCLSTER